MIWLLSMDLFAMRETWGSDVVESRQTKERRRRTRRINNERKKNDKNGLEAHFETGLISLSPLESILYSQLIQRLSHARFSTNPFLRNIPQIATFKPNNLNDLQSGMNFYVIFPFLGIYFFFFSTRQCAVFFECSTRIVVRHLFWTKQNSVIWQDDCCVWADGWWSSTKLAGTVIMIDFG